MLGDNVEDGLQIRPVAVGGQQFLLAIGVLIHDVDHRRPSFLFLLFVKINDSVVDFNDLVDILIAYEQKFDVLEILAIDLQFLVD